MSTANHPPAPGSQHRHRPDEPTACTPGTATYYQPASTDGQLQPKHGPRSCSCWVPRCGVAARPTSYRWDTLNVCHTRHPITPRLRSCQVRWGRGLQRNLKPLMMPPVGRTASQSGKNINIPNTCHQWPSRPQQPHQDSIMYGVAQHSAHSAPQIDVAYGDHAAAHHCTACDTCLQQSQASHTLQTQVMHSHSSQPMTCSSLLCCGTPGIINLDAQPSVNAARKAVWSISSSRRQAALGCSAASHGVMA
jgi:hypothetical protein